MVAWQHETLLENTFERSRNNAMHLRLKQYRTGRFARPRTEEWNTKYRCYGKRPPTRGPCGQTTAAGTDPLFDRPTLQHFQERAGYLPDERQKACVIGRQWSFSSDQARSDNVIVT